jgi:hypothetical protein
MKCLTDILITHGPPLAHLDSHINLCTSPNGCYALLTALWHARCMSLGIHMLGGVWRDAAQKAYEEVCAWSGLVSLFWWKMVAWLSTGRLMREDGATIMVNAASVRGPKDDQRLGAIAIEIRSFSSVHCDAAIRTCTAIFRETWA